MTNPRRKLSFTQWREHKPPSGTTTNTKEGPGYQTPNEEGPVYETEDTMEALRREATNTKEFTLNKLKPFDGNRKDVQSLILDCKVYLQTNRHIYDTSDSKIAFILSFMNEKEAMRWKENYLLEMMSAITGELSFPTHTVFMERLAKDFKPANKGKDAAHQIAILRQGKKRLKKPLRSSDF
jgi:hypothetical protein